jgi:hypothetical protein
MPAHFDVSTAPSSSGGWPPERGPPITLDGAELSKEPFDKLRGPDARGQQQMWLARMTRYHSKQYRRVIADPDNSLTWLFQFSEQSGWKITIRSSSRKSELWR